jgi:hypothetical protein
LPICIICRKEKDILSDEHIIPDALGGYFHIGTVCKECNSIMGNKIDIKLVDHMMIRSMRTILNLKGKKGDIPNPFQGIHQLENDASKRFQVFIDKSNQIQFHFLPSPPLIKKDLDAKIKMINISVDGKDKNKTDEILDKVLKRHHLPKEAIISKEITSIKIENPTIMVKGSYDTVEYKIALLKIAYEFTVTEIDSYFQDETARKISKMLQNASYDEADQYVSPNMVHEKYIPFSEYLDFESKKHYLVLFNIGNKLFCLVSIFGVFIMVIKLSNQTYLTDDKFIVCVNDFNNRNYYISQLLDIISNNTSSDYSYGLIFKTEKERLFFEKEAATNSELFDSDGDGLILYNATKTKLQKRPLEYVFEYYASHPGIQNQMPIETPITEDVFLKINSNSIFARLTCIVEKRTIRKI